MTAIAYNAKNASKAMSLTRAQFLALVSEGILPKPRRLGSFDLWDAQELEATIRGERIDRFEDIKW